jgi:hypothetical protein
MVAAEFQPTVEHPVPKKVKNQTILDRMRLFRKFAMPFLSDYWLNSKPRTPIFEYLKSYRTEILTIAYIF